MPLYSEERLRQTSLSIATRTRRGGVSLSTYKDFRKARPPPDLKLHSLILIDFSAVEAFQMHETTGLGSELTPCKPLSRALESENFLVDT